MNKIVDYEKLYKEALERARQVHTTNVDENKKSTEYIFPDLKESEDEKIRKDILSFAENMLKNNISKAQKDKFKFWISWLEKQGEKDKLIQELGEYKVKYTQEVLKKHMNNKNDERLRKTTISFLKDFAEQGYENAVECIDWLENLVPKPQGKTALEAIKEKKVDNAIKVEPKDYSSIDPHFFETTNIATKFKVNN